jgi:putative Holliday junction resolvase
MDGSAGLVTDNALTYGDVLAEGGALLGLDLGTKTIGVATCDAGALRTIVTERKIAGVVIGLPRNMDGTEGPRAQASRAYARNLAQTLHLPVLLWDERWSTSSAEAAMIGQDMSRAKRATKIDSHAAAIILQGAIDALAGGGL